MLLLSHLLLLLPSSSTACDSGCFGWVVYASHSSASPVALGAAVDDVVVVATGSASHSSSPSTTEPLAGAFVETAPPAEVDETTGSASHSLSSSTTAPLAGAFVGAAPPPAEVDEATVSASHSSSPPMSLTVGPGGVVDTGAVGVGEVLPEPLPLPLPLPGMGTGTPVGAVDAVLETSGSASHSSSQ